MLAGVVRGAVPELAQTPIGACRKGPDLASPPFQCTSSICLAQSARSRRASPADAMTPAAASRSMALPAVVNAMPRAFGDARGGPERVVPEQLQHGPGTLALSFISCVRQRGISPSMVRIRRAASSALRATPCRK